MKSGFPGPLNFTDWGINYEPYELELSQVVKRKEVQFLISNFSNKSFDHKFEINISIGNPSLINKKMSDIFIPTKTPGIDTDGLVLRSDGSKVIKLQKKFKSNYIENSDLIDKIFS
jgi:formylmethanofuran dehydrogenase subunit B